MYEVKSGNIADFLADKKKNLIKIHVQVFV